MKPTLHLALAFGCCLLLASNAAAQRDDSAALTAELAHLGAAAAELDHSLPSFTCQENVSSQLLRGKKTLREAHFIATLRAKRGPTGKLNETYTVTSLNGQPFSGSTFDEPLYVAGGFDSALRYFAPANQACYNYKLSRNRIAFSSSLASSAHAGCNDEGLDGFALLDADGNITHLERHVSRQAVVYLHEAAFATIDFTNVTLDGHTYRLSNHLLAQMPAGPFTGRFEASYTDCHLYKATVTFGPATEAQPDTTPPPR
jgi:hypothetical protein